MKIECQQQDIFKIKDGIPGHGLQEVKKVFIFETVGKYVDLECGCSIPFSYLPTKEQEMLNENV